MHTTHSMPTSGIGRFSRLLLTELTKREDAKTALPERAFVRPLGQMAAVGVLALLLAGSMAAPTEAMKRSQTVKIVNGIIGMCFSAGGDPYVGENAADGGFNVYCHWEDGSFSYGWWDYEPEDEGGEGGDAPVRGRAVSQSAQVGGPVMADDASVDAVDHGRKKAHKQKHKAHSGKHGNKHRR